MASAAAGLTGAGAALAQTWNVNGNGSWGTAANWSPVSVPNGVGASASLPNILTAARTITLNLPVTLGTLSLDGGFNYTISGTGAANTLRFDALAGNAALNVTGTAVHTISRPVVLTDTLVINQGSTGTLTLSGARSGTGGLIKNGTGQVTLSGAGSFTGQTQINNGTILYNTAGAIPAASLVTIGDGIGAAGSAVLNVNASLSAAQALNVTLASDGVLIQNNNRLVRLSAVSGTGELRLNTAVGNGFEITGTGGNTTFSGAVTGGIALNSANPATGSRFTKTGAATLTLDGNNTYVARTFINAGSLRAASNTALGAASAGFDNATFVYSTGSLQLSNNITLAERIYLNGTGGGTGALRNFSGNNTITGNVTLGWTGTGVAAAAASIGADAGTTLTISGNIDGAQSLTKVGAGTLVLSGSNTWSGATTVSAGTLRLGVAAGMPNATVLTVNGGTFDLNGFSKTVTSLSGTGGAIALGAGALTVNQLAARTYAGVISGTGSLTKNGASTLTLTGANTYSGGTTVGAGTLAGNATSLQGNIVNNAIVAFNQTATGTYAGSMSGTGRLTKSGAGTLTLTGANSYAGGTTVSAGTLQGNSTSLQGNIAASNSAVIFDQAVAGTYAGAMSGNASLTKTGAGTLTLTGANSYTGGTRFNGGTIAAASDARLGTGSLTFNGGALQTLAAFNSAKAVSLLGAGTIDTNGFNANFTGAITGAGSLVKTGAGTLMLTGNNTFSGGTTVSAGTLQGNTTSLRNTIVNNAAVIFNQTAAGTYAGVMSGTGSLTKIGAGTLTVSGANTYSGGTTVSAGTLSGTATSLQGNIVNNAAVVFNQTAAGTYAGAMSGTGLLTKSGAGTLALTGANSYAGGTTVTAGALQGSTTSLQGNIVNNASVVFDQAMAGTYAGAMSGTGSLTKNNANTLTLIGANTYSGGTTINAGTVAVAGDAQLGSGNLMFNGGALQTTADFASAKNVTLVGASTIDTNGFAADLAGSISGAGALTKAGAGILTLTGVNTYAGGTTVSAGTLQGNSTSLQGMIFNNAAVVFDQAVGGTYAGVMAGTGSLTKNNAGTLLLTGANTYAGGTTVNAGTLQGNSTSLQGNIANKAAVVFDQASAGTYTGVMSGAGSLTKNNAGTLILSGANTYSGGTVVNGGTLQGNASSLQGNIVNNASVVFDQDMDGTYSAAMSGTGALTKLGAGNLTIGGVNTFSGSTAVNAGTLTVLGSMTSNLLLASGTTLTGNGAVGGINAAAGSTVAPGNAQSTLTANGAYTHSDGATFRVHADASGAASRLNVNGAATLAGGTVDVQAEDGNYAAATRYTIVNANAGVGGMFGSVTSNLAFLTPTLEYDPTNVFLTLARNGIDFATVASTANQLQVSNAFDQATAANATGDIATVIDAVTALSAPQARSAYESMGGLVHTLLPTIGIADVNQFNRASASRLRARTDGTTGTGLAWSGIKLASAPSPQSDAPALFASTGGIRGTSDAASRNVWLSGYGLDGDLNGDASSGKYDYRISGLIIGVDTDIDRHWTGGLSAAYSDWRVRNDGRGDRSDVKAYRIGGYGRFSDGPIRVDGVVGYGNVHYETARRIAFGTINRTAHADYSGEQFTANVVGRYRIEQGHYGIEPFAALQYVLESQDGFVEAGADSVNLTVASRTLKSTRGTLGARVDRAFDTAGGKGLVEIRAGYSREFSGVPNIGASFIGDPTRTGLSIVAENFDRDSWLAGAGVSFAPQKNLTLYVDVNGDFQSQGTLVSVMGGMRLSW